MVTVEFLGPIQKESLELSIENLTQLGTLLGEDETMKNWLECCAIAVNDALVKDKNYSLKDGDKISLLPPVCGG